jgi:cytidylate kinase
MKIKTVPTIYIISGPVGVGKSTITTELAKLSPTRVRIEGDLLLAALDEKDVTWEEKLKLCWQNIVAVTRNIVDLGFDVVIDFVLEDEIHWFSENISDKIVNLKYFVLIAEKEIIIDRITKQGDNKSVERATELLNIFTNSDRHKEYLIDTTNRTIDDIVKSILSNQKYVISMKTKTYSS